MMDSLTACCINRFIFPSSSSSSRRKNLSFSRKPSFLVFASKEEHKFDHWDQMELKFGRMIGEDPKLTLAKIMGRKLNPDASYLEIEKSYHKNKGKPKNDIENLPFDANDMCRPIDSSKNLNLVRPVLKKGMKFKSDDTPIDSQLKKPSPSLAKVVSSSKASVPNVILRKPSTFYEDNVEMQKPSRLKIKPNLLLKMRKEQSKDDFSDIMLLKKPEPVKISANSDPDNASSGDSVGPSSMELIECGSTLPSRLATIGEANVSDDLEESSLSSVSASDLVNVAKNDIHGSPEPSDDSVSKLSELEDKSKLGLQPIEQSDVGFTGKEAAETQSLDRNSVNSIRKFSMQAELQGKPQRFDPSTKERSHPSRVETVPASDESYRDAAEVEQFLATPPLQESEDADWKRAEDLLETGGRGEVELISGSTRGFVVSFGSLIGFLPYRNLGAKWKFLAFESWLRRKGLDPSMYKQNLGIIGSYGVQNKNPAPNANLSPAIEQKIEGELSPDMKLEDLLEIYDQEKIKFLSSFVGQRIKVNVVMADRKSRKLMFSGRPKEKEELVEKKRSLMAKLSIGDVVKCCIKKITYFGIFVEVEGVPALIHQTEVSWDSTLNPSSYFKIGQIVEAKVHQLDFALERITLSLKQITPDPLIEALESVVGEHNSLEGRLEAVQSDVEWADVESLIKELQQIEGIQSVSKGRFFLSPGLAPTFQVYMTSMFENQYKLLARSAKKVQELFVRTSLDKEAIKAAILSCTNRVE